MGEKKICSEHKGKAISFICMDPFCKEIPSCCILCIKGNHGKCGDSFIIEIEEQNTKIKIINSSCDMDDLSKRLGSLID